MKRIFLVFAILVLMVGNAFAASSIVAATGTRGGIAWESPDGSKVLLKLTCTAHTDGAFDSKVLTSSVISGVTKFGTYYYQTGFKIINAWTVNDGTTAPASGAVTITDASTQQIIGTTAGDTLTLGTSTSSIALLSIDRGSSQRTITDVLTMAVSSVTTNGGIFTFYLLLGL